MGGFGSGRQDGCLPVRDCFPLDVGKLLRDRCLDPGRWTHGILRWTEVRSGRETASLAYEADLRDPAAAWLRLRYGIGEGEARRPFDYRVGLATTRPGHGGLRWWFLCSTAGRRRARLHRPPGGDLFAARRAWRLGYRSQRLAPPERRRETAEGRASRVRRRLGGADHDEVPPRPRGMWRRTFRRLRREAEAAEWLAGGLALAEMAALVERAGGG